MKDGVSPVCMIARGMEARRGRGEIVKFRVGVE